MTNQLSIVENSLTLEVTSLIQKSVLSVREDMQDNPYILEAIRVLSVQGYRSAIGCFWNAVVDDLRNKILYRSIDLFNKEIKPNKEIKNYEDFQNYINDDQLIDGAYKIGVIGWEAQKILKHAKETRHIFDGHPKSSDPSIIKVLDMFNDCIKYVLNQEYPSKIIDINEYIKVLEVNTFDRNVIAVSNAFGDLPEIYKQELINRFFNIYIHPQTTSILSSNIEFVSPILWGLLTKDIKLQIVRRIDQLIIQGNSDVTNKGFSFVRLVNANGYLSQSSREYKLQPLINNLKQNTHNWSVENQCVRELYNYADIVPNKYIRDYVWALTHTYIGNVGYSYNYSRTDFYANEASVYIPQMFEKFNNEMIEAFIETIKTSDSLKRIIETPSKLRRLRNLAVKVEDKLTTNNQSKDFLRILLDETKEKEFFDELR
ncbi:Uncharacterised protein [Actinobacillus lignieresii]|uniref:hypothetical protein n=1 Tax=Actinobacillus lignieresii TaxID=720 RepID=UPI000E146D45|nr:hypothetical protein [Actinobacillus lignieresii]SUU01021.1 Uncharacterised protein [Actinobacillus lignieresii]